jgi:hypothetical protein
VRATLVVRTSSMAIATKRSILRAESLTVQVEDPTEAVLRRFTYPDYIASTTGTIELLEPGPEGEPPQVRQTYTIESFRDPLPYDVFANQLPELLAAQWGDVIYELNPGWMPLDEEAQKKLAGTSTDASPS